MDTRNWVDFAFDGFIESSKVGYPTDCVVLFGDDESTTYSRRAASRRKNTDFDKSMEFSFEFRKLGLRNWIGATAVWRDAFVDVEVYQFVGIMSEDSVKHGDVILKNAVKLFMLVSCLDAYNCL